MKKTFTKQILAYALSTAMIISSITLYHVPVSADMEISEMVANTGYNLALNKKAMAKPSKQEGNEAALTDGSFTGEHAATTFNTQDTFFQIDLGKAYDASTIDYIVTNYKENNPDDTPRGGYQIQYSADGINFNTVKNVAWNDTGVDTENLTDVQDVSDATGVVRYVKLLYPGSYGYGIQAREIAVIDKNQDAKAVEIEKCADAAGITVTASGYNKITYNITAGKNQENFKYLVYLDNYTEVGYAVKAGVDYDVDNITAGTHMLFVVAVDNGKVSPGIQGDPFVVSDISEMITDKKNISNKVNNPNASISSVSAFFEGHTIASAQVALDGSCASGEGADVALRTAKGSPQSVIVDLGNYYTPSEFDKVVIGYSNPRTYASDTKVEFSRNGKDFVEVTNAFGYVCKKDNSDTADMNVVKLDHINNFTDSAVRYVKLTLSGGSTGYGYVINEIGVYVNTETPTIVQPDVTEVGDIEIVPNGFEKIQYKIKAGENQEEGYTYNVFIDGVKVADEIIPSKEYESGALEAGTHNIKAVAIHDNWVSGGISKNVDVDGYTNYINTSLNLVQKYKHPDVLVSTDADNQGENYVPTSQDISAGPGALNDGIYTNNSHHTGYLQTMPTRDDATIIYDLAQSYKPSDIHSVITMFETANNAATEYKIFFSGDGEKYEEVFYGKDVTYKQFINDVIDTSKYTQDSVRYVKYHILNGNYMRYVEGQYGSSGYHLCELAVMGNHDLLPEKIKNLKAESPEYNMISISWDKSEAPDYTYRVYVDRQLMDDNLSNDTTSMTYKVRAGNHSVIVATVKNGIETLGDPVSVTVETETAKPTEKPTVKPTAKPTVKPTEASNPTVKNDNTTVKTFVNTWDNVSNSKIGKAKISKVKIGAKKVSIKLKKVTGATGYVIKYSVFKNMKKAKAVTSKKLSVTIKKLKKGKVYYFKACAFKTINGRKIYGPWTSAKRSKKIK